ncbi:probable serine/threonine-protein kinase At1g54610 [Rhododendron vialii]|uniref:probable serine/threonine-protein kinase At1g54610 n=1 Tax=Rhododendron vialii TaxID=182163 RepID=UPI0026604BAD|nr:probable serine/threonine-protein kinase At1g54610 [Rhododendron vialii]
MGCAQGKSLQNSPLCGLHKLKMENEYVKANHGEARRSTGPRYLGNDLGNIPRPEPRNSCTAIQDDNLTTKDGKTDKVVVGGDSGGCGSGQNISERMRSLNVVGEEQLVDGWPKWLTDNIPRDVLAGIVARSADSYDKLYKVGQGTYSNVYKARDRETGKIVALKKVKFDTSEPKSVKFMAREIMILQKLDHPNIVKLVGLATSRMHYSLYLVFDYMYSDLSSIISRPEEKLTEPQIKCYIQQLLSGLQHCHDRGILHRDIKGSNLLIDKNGMLKIADFGLANYFDPNRKRHLTSRVVTLWYRAPELLLGATDYGVGIDLWSAGCVMAEMFTGRPIMPGRTEVEQLHRIFKLCGTPSDDYWKKLKVSPAIRPPLVYKPSLQEVFREFPPSSSALLYILLDLDPVIRGSAASALQSEFFFTSPLACDNSGLPVVYKEEDQPFQTNERRMHWKMRHQSRKQKECQKKDIVAMDEPQGDFGFSKDEPKKSSELNLYLGVSATTTSSSKKHAQPKVSPTTLFSPDLSSCKNTSFEAHPNPANKIKNLPPLPNAKARTILHKGDNDNKYKLSRVTRSVSSREFRKLDQRKYLRLQAVDDY